MKAKFEFKISGFIIAIILVAMFGSVFGLTMASMSSEYGVTDPESFAKYSQYTETLENNTGDIKDDIDEYEQETGILDIVGAYFSAGWTALKTALTSFNLFGTMLNDATEDIEQLSMFKTYLTMIILIAIFVGVVIAVLVKMRI